MQTLIKELSQLPEGEYLIKPTIVLKGVAMAKKRYFAMVTELANHCGYMSKKDRELFKEQIKAELGDESIADMTDPLQIGIKIEELHNLAQNHYSFTFPIYERNDS